MGVLLIPAQNVAANGTVATAYEGTPPQGSMGSAPALGYPSELTVAVKVSAATTITINISYDGVNWVSANIRNTNTAASIVFAGAGAQALNISPAPYVQLVTTNAVKVQAWVYYY